MWGNRFPKSYIFIGCALAYIALFLPLPSYAAGSEDFAKEVFDLLNVVIGFISRAWVIPATIAGKLMTNDFIYGEAFYFDRYLWRMWTFMRTMALFTLGFLLVVDILKAYFKQEGTSALLGAIKKVALAGIIIPMTRWLMAVVIDMATVATATVSSLPLQVMQQQRNSLKYGIQIPKRIEIDASGKINQTLLAQTGNYTELTLEAIMPQADSIAGPFIFMGAALLKLQESNYVPVDIKDWKKLSLASIIKVVVLFSFALPLFVLMIVNMMRVFYIWLWIIFSPFLVLDYFYKGPLSKVSEVFKLSNMFGLVFQPVVIVGLLSLGMILVIGVSDILLGGSEYERGSLEQLQVVCGNDSTCIIGPKVLAEITIKGQLFQKLGSTVGGIVGEIILVVFVVFLLWALVKAGFETSKLTKGVADSMYKFAGGMVGNAQIIPGGLSWNNVTTAASRLANSAEGALNKNSIKQGEKITQPLEALFGMNKRGFSELDQHELTEVINKHPNDKKTMTREFWKKMHAILGEKQTQGNDTQLRASLEHWLQKGGFDEMETVLPGFFTPEQLTEYKADPTKIRTNTKMHQFFDRMLKAGAGADFESVLRKTDGLHSIDATQYGATRN